MRQIFQSLPYFLPADPAPIRALFEKTGSLRRVKKGEVLKRGGEDAKLFFVKSGLFAYQLDGTASGRIVYLSIIPPGRALGDLTASVHARANVVTVALEASEVWVTAPGELTRAMRDGRVLPEIEIANVIAKEESLLEGMTANFTLPPEVRLRVFLKAMVRSFGVPIETNEVTEPDDPQEPRVPRPEPLLRLPLTVTAETIGDVLNLNRVSVSKIFSKWTAAGLARRDGRSWCVSPALFDDLYDWIEHPGSGGHF